MERILRSAPDYLFRLGFKNRTVEQLRKALAGWHTDALCDRSALVWHFQLDQRRRLTIRGTGASPV